MEPIIVLASSSVSGASLATWAVASTSSPKLDVAMIPACVGRFSEAVTPGSPGKPCPVRGAHARERPVRIAGIQEPEPVTRLHLLVQPVRYVSPCLDARFG